MLRYLGIGLLALAGLIVVGAGALTLTPPGLAKIADIASSMASGPGRTVKISGLSGIWSGALHVDTVDVADARGAWLTLKGLNIDWSPLALLGGQFSASKIEADTVDLARRPEAAESTAGNAGGSGGPVLPLAVDVKALDLPQIHLGADFTGTPVTLAATGALSAGGSPVRIRGQAHIRRADGKAGDFDTNLSFVPQQDRIEVKLTASEPGDGIIANLLQLPGRPPVDLQVSGSGPLSDWSGKGTLKLAGQLATRVAVTRKTNADGTRYTATGDGEFANLLPKSIRPIAAGTTAFDAAATLSDDGAVSVEHAHFASDALTADASGSIDPKGNSNLKVSASAKSAPVTLSLPGGDTPATVGLESLDATIKGSGGTAEVNAEARLSALSGQGFGLEDVAAHVSAPQFDLAELSGKYDVTVTAGSATSDNTTLAPLLSGALKLAATGELTNQNLDVTKGTLTTGTVDAELAGRYARDTGTVELDTRTRVQTAALPAATRRFLADRAQLRAKINRTATGDVTVSGIDLTSGQLSAKGTVSLKGKTLSADLSGGIGDVAQISGDATGAIDFNATLKGPVAAPDFSLKLAGKSVKAAGRTITGLDLSAEGTADPAAPTAKVALSGKVGGDALSGSADLSTNGTQRTLSDLSLTLAGNKVTGNLELGADMMPVSGAIDFSLPDIAPLAALALQQASGNAKGSVQFSRTDGTPSLKVSANAGTLAFGTTTAKDVTIDARIDDYLGKRAVNGSLAAKSVSAGGARIADASADFAPQNGWTGFSGKADVNGMPSSLKGRVQFAENGGTTLELADARTRIKGIDATLSAPARVTVANGTAKIDKAVLGIGKGKAEISGSAGQKLDLDAKLTDLPASVANAFADNLGADGTVSGTLKIAGTPASPRIDYNADWRNAALAQTRSAGIGAFNVSAKGTLAGGNVKIDATASGGNGLSVNAAGTVALAPSTALDLKVTGKVPFSLLTRRLAQQGMSLSGTSDLSLTVKGAPTNPALSGALKTSGATFVDTQAGVAVRKINATIDLGGNKATIREMTGSLATGGTISASGSVTIGQQSDLPADLKVKINNGRYTDGRIVTANLDADLTITGSLIATPTLGGRIALGRTVITVPEKLPASLTSLDVQHANAPAAVQEQAKALKPRSADGSQAGIKLDLSVDAPRRIFVQGRGVDAELGGSLKLTGTARSPFAVGRFQLVRGRLSILNRRLEFTGGTLGFEGSLIPNLDMTATTSTANATVTVNVTGPATKPDFAFSSDPALPQDEILAQLIFGQAMSDLSPLQIAQLAGAASQLAGVGGSTSLLEQLQNQLGVDNLDVNTDPTTGDTNVSVGKYLNDKTYVTLQQNTTTGESKATVDLNVGKNVKLRGEATDTGETKGGIFYELNY